MDASRLQVNQLQRRNPDAWTALLRRYEPLQDVDVLRVGTEVSRRSNGFTRYLLTLAGHTDPVPLIGKRTNGVEAQFYSELAEHVPGLTPRCWLSHSAEQQSWLVLDDVPNHRPGYKWTADDVEKIIGALAVLHARFWELAGYLAARDWLPARLRPPQGEEARRGYMDLMRQGSHYLGLGRAAVVSAHALQVSGRLAPTFMRAAAAVELLHELDGWPGVIEEPQLDALVELLDDPLPVLQPLRELPVTLLHGNLSPHHWHLTLFNDRYLLDWQSAQVGPPVWDLVSFLEQTRRVWAENTLFGNEMGMPATEETMVDSYLLRMSMLLGSSFPARAMRQAIPAALCLHVVTDWLPRLADLVQRYAASPATWQVVTHGDDLELIQAGMHEVVYLREYLADLFVRFRQAYNRL